ncbi:MAG: hypothetical protein KTR16_16240 [Acidiferrobacterales bacterium]|nr:hypothetical protein [Acidiferrobacterales bacterium]
MTAILYISDNDIRLQKTISSTEEQIIRSQGYAWFKGDKVVFDTDHANAPIKSCRLAPQEMNNRYWSQCEKSSIAKNMAGMRHAADLIWKHLSELQKQHQIDQLIVIVPSHYQSNNLQLLLGIFQSLNIEVVGLVNGALLSLQDKVTQDGDYRHIDVQLHQTVCSHFRVDNGLAKLGNVEIIQSVGIQAIQDTLLKVLQTQFIQNDRFDPLHYAETEQQLFDALPDIALVVNESAKAMVNVKHQNQSYNSSIDMKIWSDALSPYINELESVAAESEKAFIQFNGAFDPQAMSMVVAENINLLEPLLLNNIPSSLLQKESDGSLHYVTELEIADSSSALDSVDNVRSNNTSKSNEGQNGQAIAKTELTGATHLLQAGIAIPIEHCGLEIEGKELILHARAKGNAQSLLASGKLFVMGDDSCKEFRPNDRLGSHLADGVITVIQVV